MGWTIYIFGGVMVCLGSKIVVLSDDVFWGDEVWGIGVDVVGCCRGVMAMWGSRIAELGRGMVRC